MHLVFLTNLRFARGMKIHTVAIIIHIVDKILLLKVFN